MIVNIETAPQAVAAAIFISRSTRLKNPRALLNLSQWAAEKGLFSVSDHDADWAAYERRRAAEAARDPIVFTKNGRFSPKVVHNEDHRQRIDTRSVREAERDPMIAVRARLAQANITDRASCDFKDPKDYDRTKLHKAVDQNNLPEIKRLFEHVGANPFVTDANGQTPLGLSEMEGYFNIADYLRNAMREFGLNCGPIPLVPITTAAAG